MNSVVITGNITRDIELKYSSSQTAVVRFTVAVSRRRKEDGADFINCVAFGKTAENMDKFLHKGSKVGVKGRLQTGSYMKDEIKINTTDVIADEVEFLDSRQLEVDYKVAEPEPEGFAALNEQIPF